MRRTRLGIAIALCTLAGACASPSGGLSGSDSESTYGGLRATWEIPRPRFSDGKPPPRQFLLELEGSATGGDFTQSVASGGALVIDGTTYSGPSAVQASFDAQQVSVAGRMRLRNGVGLGVDGIAGIGFTRLDLATASFAASSDLEQQGLGPVLGTGVFFELPPRLRFFAELTWQPTFVGSGDVADVQVFDVGADVRLTEAIGLVLSWRDFSYQEERDGAESDLDLSARGPRLTLMLQL